MADRQHEADRQHKREDHDIRLPDLERPGPHHEASDIDVWAVAKFGIALACLCVFALALLFGVFKYFQSITGGPMSKEELNVDARRMPPEPRLQQAPITDLKEMRAAEDKILNSYGWIDQAHGIVRVPIDRAIDMLAQKGLPSRPQNGPQSASNATVPQESGLGPIMTRPGGPLAGEAAQQAPAQQAPAQQPGNGAAHAPAGEGH